MANGRQAAETVEAVATDMAMVMTGIEAILAVLRDLKSQPDLPVPPGKDANDVRRYLAISITEVEKLRAVVGTYCYFPYQPFVRDGG